MEVDEVLNYFGDPNQRGLIVENSGQVVAWTGFNTYQGFFYAHSTFCTEPIAYVAIIKRLTKLAREYGFSAVRFCIDQDNAWYLEKAQAIKGVRPISHVFELEVST